MASAGRSSTPALRLTADGNYECPDDPGEASYKNWKRRSVTPEEADILRGLAEGKKVIEVGTGLGVSTRAMADTALEVVSVDTDPWCHSFAFPDNVRLLREIPDESFDFAFIDGNHSFESVLRDIRSVKAPLLAIHDHYLDDVREAVFKSDLRFVEKYDTRCEMVLCSRL